MKPQMEVDIRVLIVCSNLGRYVWIVEDGGIAARLRRDSGTLDILVVAETDIDRRVSHGLEQLRAGMFVEHPLAECTELLPLVSTVLQRVSDRRLCVKVQ